MIILFFNKKTGPKRARFFFTRFFLAGFFYFRRTVQNARKRSFLRLFLLSGIPVLRHCKTPKNSDILTFSNIHTQRGPTNKRGRRSRAAAPPDARTGGTHPGPPRERKTRPFFERDFLRLFRTCVTRAIVASHSRWPPVMRTIVARVSGFDSRQRSQKSP